MRVVAFPNMSQALNDTGHPVVFACDTDQLFTTITDAASTGEKPYMWAPATCNSWRTGPDIIDSWDSITSNLALNNKWYFGEDLDIYAGPSKWNDPDLLVIGFGSLNTTQYLTQFMLWALMDAPLMVSFDIRNISADNLAILLASEIIAVNQDPAGVQGSLVARDAGVGQIWVKPMADQSKVVVLFNPGGTGPRDICVTWAQLGWADNVLIGGRDLWLSEDLGQFRQNYCQKNILDYGASIIQFTPVSM